MTRQITNKSISGKKKISSSGQFSNVFRLTDTTNIQFPIPAGKQTAQTLLKFNVFF